MSNNNNNNNNSNDNNSGTVTSREEETDVERIRRVNKYKRIVFNFYSGSQYEPCYELIPIGIYNVILQELVRRHEFTQGVTFVKTVLPSMNNLLYKSPIIVHATSHTCAM